jgi:hypothetical protein
MKSTLLHGLLLVLLTGGCSSRPYQPLWIDRPGELCVERPEENGRLNITPAEVVIESSEAGLVIWDRQFLTLVGGQAVCAVLPAAEYRVHAHSDDPYDSNREPNEPEPEAWESQTLTVSVQQGKRVELWLCGGGQQGYSHWNLKRPHDQSSGGCEWEEDIR